MNRRTPGSGTSGRGSRRAPGAERDPLRPNRADSSPAGSAANSPIVVSPQRPSTSKSAATDRGRTAAASRSWTSCWFPVARCSSAAADPHRDMNTLADGAEPAVPRLRGGLRTAPAARRACSAIDAASPKSRVSPETSSTTRAAGMPFDARREIARDGASSARSRRRRAARRRAHRALVASGSEGCRRRSTSVGGSRSSRGWLPAARRGSRNELSRHTHSARRREWTA